MQANEVKKLVSIVRSSVSNNFNVNKNLMFNFRKYLIFIAKSIIIHEKHKMNVSIFVNSPLFR